MGFAESSGRESPRGIMILNPGVRAVYEHWKITQTGCQVRLYPELDAQGNALPIRVGREVSDVGNWVNADHYGINYLGGGDPSKEKVTMLVSIKGDENCNDPSQRRGLRIWDQLRNTLYYLVDNGTAPPHWARWMASARDAVFGPKSKSKAKPQAFCRGMITWYNTPRGPMRTISAQTPKTDCILQFGPAAQSALIELAMEETSASKNYQGDDWDQVFLHNSKLVDPQTGCLINFGKPGQFDPAAQQNAQAQAQASPVNFGSAAAGGNKQRDDDTYQVQGVIVDQACPIPQDILNHVCMRPWTEVLQTWEDERDMIAALEVGFPDDLIIAAFGDQPDLLSERLRSKMHRDAQTAQAGNVAAVQGAAPAVTQHMPPPVQPGQMSPAMPQQPQPGQVAPTAPAVQPGQTVPPIGPTQVPPWEQPNTGTAPAVGQTPPATGAPVTAPATTESGGATTQPDGTAPQGVDKMLAALKNVTPPSGS